MSALKLLVAPLRSVVRFPLVQLAAVVAVVLLLQAADDGSVLGRTFNALDKLVGTTVQTISAALNVKSFTKSWLTTSFWICYVYLAGLLILWLLSWLVRLSLDFAGRWNLFWLRPVIARERGIAAYQAWEPFERLRPGMIPQNKWEETYAWPADGSPPYLPWPQRLLRGALGYVLVFVTIVLLFQYLTPFPALTWLCQLMRLPLG
jgi:hypothetical protein